MKLQNRTEKSTMTFEVVSSLQNVTGITDSKSKGKVVDKCNQSGFCSWMISKAEPLV